MEAQAGQPDPDQPEPDERGRRETYGTGPDPLGSHLPDLNADDDGPFRPWLPPEDRLWRHPSESSREPASPAGATRTRERPPAAAGAPARAWMVAVAAGLCGALAASGIGLLSGWWPARTTVIRAVTPVTSSVTLAATGAAATNWAAVDDSVAPSIVGLAVDGPSGLQLGSGLVVATTGDGYAYVVTDRSLFSAGGAAGYTGPTTVTFLSGTQARGRLVGQDALSGLALVEVTNASRVVAPSTGTTADLRDADPVMVVGSRATPGGSVFPGSISGEDRKVPVSDGSDMDNLIALSVPALSPAATGGPLLDAYGRVVGMTLALDPVEATDRQFSFAVPIDEVTRVATQIMEGSRVTHPWLGIDDAEDVPSAMAHQYGLTGGVQAGDVAPGSPAGRAGMKAHDILTSFDGQPVTSTGSLIFELEKRAPGQSVGLTFIDAGRTVQTTVKLADEPFDAG